MKFAIDTHVMINGLIVTGAAVFFLIILLVLAQSANRLFFRKIAATPPKWLKISNPDQARKKIN